MYCTVADLTARFGEDELAALVQPFALDDPEAQVALDLVRQDASAEIDSYLAARYSLPLPTVPPVLSRLACDLTRYYLYDDAAPEQVRQRYEDAIKLLNHLATGVVSLGLPTEDEPAATGEAAFTTGESPFARKWR